MAHKTLVGGTAYEVKGGKTLINGTAYEVKGGKTLVGGTAYGVGFGKRLFDFGTITTKNSWLTGNNSYTPQNRIVLDFDPLECNVLIVDGVEYSIEAFTFVTSGLTAFGMGIVGGVKPTINKPNVTEEYPYSIWITADDGTGTNAITFYSYTAGTYKVSLWKKK